MSGHPRPERIEDHVLGLAADDEVRAHLDVCGECAERAGRIEAERTVMAEALSVPPPSGLARRILDAAATGRRRRGWTSRLPLAAAAAVFLAVVAILVLRHPPAGANDYILGDGSRVIVAAGSEALFPGARQDSLELRRGSARFRLARESKSFRVVTPIGKVTAQGAEFSVELQSRVDAKGEAPMETLLALVVTVIAGNVQVDAAGASTALTAGETHVFAAALALQDNDDGEKGQKGKNEKGKKNDKDDGDKEDGKRKEKKGDKGEKEDDGKEKGEKKKDKKEDD
jgi:ferric-dicitrate binding protein FerR (iron transport regulator)